MMMKLRGAWAAVVLAGWFVSPAVGSDIDFAMKTLEGKEVQLAEKYDGQVLLIVNVASRCGLTPQYKGLQALHEKYQDQGLRVVGFPCNQFGGQEPGTASEIREFCSTNYGVTFDLFSKIDVNGPGAADLYKHLTSLDTSPVGAGDISWNFEKFVVGRDGQVIARFGPRTRPDDAALVRKIETAVAQEAKRTE
jgi:glutathione peroxidase